jgi:hypothetical protein
MLAYREKLALLLGGTSEGAAKGWETRKHGGTPAPTAPAPAARAAGQAVRPVVRAAAAAYRSPRPAARPAPRPVARPAAPDYGYGFRHGTKTPKGLGFFGPLQRPDGGVMTEFSVGVNINGREMEVPTFVPTLTAEEVTTLLTLPDGQPIPPSIIKKAHQHAVQRVAQGLDPFAQPGEQTATHPELQRAPVPTPRVPAPARAATTTRTLPARTVAPAPSARALPARILPVKKLHALLLDKDEHGYGSYPRGEGARFFDRNPRLSHYRSVPIVRSEHAGGGRHPEAEARNGKVYLYPKFDALSPEAQDHVIAHEIGHLVLDKHGLSALVKDAAAMGIDVWDTPSLPFGQSNSHEAFADAFASLHTTNDVATRYPKWARLVEQVAKQHKPTHLSRYREFLAALSVEWEEAQHPRGEGGRFIEGEGSDEGRAVVQIGTKPDGGKLNVFALEPLPKEAAKAVFPHQDPAEIVAAMVEHIPGDLTVGMQVVHRIYGNLPAVEVTAEGQGEMKGLKIQRTFIRDHDGTLRVFHDKFEVPKSAQGHDLAKQVIEDSLKQYRALGVQRIDTYANLEMGGYAWAKFGFKASNPGKMASRLHAMLTTPQQKEIADRLPVVNDRERADLLGIIDRHKNDPKLPWHVAAAVTADGRQVGKSLLTTTVGWDGTLDLHDTEAVSRMERYIAQRKPRK